MANNTYNYGFRWHSNFTGGEQPKPIRMRVASGYDAAPGGVHVNLRVGDWVKETTDGTVILAVAGDALLGVISSINPYYDSGVGAMVYNDSLPYANGVYSTNLERESSVMVIPSNGVIWQAMCDDATTATTQAAYTAFIHENVDLINAAVTGTAHPLIDISLHATTTAQFRIVDLLRRPDVDYSGLYVPLLVTVNEGRLPPFSASGV